MKPASLPLSEADRTAALRRYELLDTPPEQSLDDLTLLAAKICEAPISVISLVDEEREWFKSRVGFDLAETPRDIAFSAHAILTPDLFMVPDVAADGRFSKNPLVTGAPRVRFYAGAPLITPDGDALGTLCIMDRVPRTLTPTQQEALRVLSRQVMAQIELRRQTQELRDSEDRLLRVFGSCPVALSIHRMSDRTFVDINEAFTALVGWRRDEVIGRTTDQLGIIEPAAAAAVRAKLVDGHGLRDQELEIRARTGESRYVIMGTEFVTFRGAPHAITTFVDITARKEAEDALRHHEAILEETGRIAKVGGWEFDAVTGAGTWTDEVARIHDLEPGPTSVTQGLAFYSDQSRSQIEAAVNGALTNATSYDLELEILTAKGNRKWIRTIGQPVLDEHGKVVQVRGSFQDITERRQVEATLIEKQRRIEHLNRVYAVLSDINQTIVREKDPAAMLDTACQIAVTKGRFRLAWIRVADPAGHSFFAIHSAPGSMPPLIEQVDLSDRVYLAGAHVICNDVEHDAKAREWRAVALEAGYRAVASLPLWEAGAVIGTINLYADEAGAFDAEELKLLDELAMDVGFALGVSRRDAERLAATARDAAQQRALRDSEDRFRELAETIQEVFWIVDPQAERILYISPAYEAVWRRSVESILESSQSWLEAVHPDDRERVRTASESKHSDGSYDEVYRIVWPDGAIRWIHDRAFPVRDADGVLVRIVGTAEDITAQRDLEEQFRQAQKMEAIGQLAGGVAHDFNNILAAIMMQADLSSGVPSQDETRDILEEIRAAAERAANLTRQLLAFSRRQVMRPRPINLNDVVTSLAKMLERIVGEDVTLDLALLPGPLWINADSGMLDQVLMNLVVNARDAMPGGGRVTIETAVRAQSVCLRVRDTGEGIAPEHLSRIFEPFFSTKEQGKGTGLGLATVFGIVKQHGGAVTAESQVGRGTAFEIVLPALAERPTVVDSVAPKPEPRGGTETILLVEDDNTLRLLTRALLERAGYRVLDAAHGVAALALWEVHRESIRLLYTDLVMPKGISGRDLAVRMQGESPTLRVIFSSGYSADIAGRELVLHEGENFLQKPAAPEQVLETVRRALD